MSGLNKWAAKILATMRAEFNRQASMGAYYREAWEGGPSDCLDGDFDLGKVAEAIAVTINSYDPATTIYGRLLSRHADAARTNFAGHNRVRIFNLIQEFRSEFPDECKVWEDRYTVKDEPQ